MPLNGGLHELVHIGFVANVGMHKVGAQCAGCPGPLNRVQIGQHHVSPFLTKALDTGCTYAACTPRHNHNASLVTK
jgi:hypothetical protein